MKQLLFSILIFIALAGHANDVDTIPEVGNHSPILTYEKNENPENIMVIYTRLGSQCTLEADPNNGGQAIFDFYWMMDRKNYKPVHPVIKSEIRKRLELVPSVNKTSFFVKINDLNEVNCDIKNPALEVKAKETSDKNCAAEAFITLGPSDRNIRIKLRTIYSDSEKTILPPFRKVKAITLIGENVVTGEKVQRKYKGRSN